MKDHSNTSRAFVWSSKAYYADTLSRDGEEIMFGMYCLDGGGTSGEMAMKWVSLGNKNVPQLQIYDDAWSALSLFSDLIQRLGEVDNENITPNEFIDILKSCGFADITKYEDPDGKTSADRLREELALAELKVKAIKSRLSAA